MPQCLTCGSPCEAKPCPTCGVAEPFVLHLVGRGASPPRTSVVRFDGSVATWISGPLLLLAQKERWICHICELPVARACPMDHHAAPSRDHIIPRRHERGLENNVKLAHKWCNSERQDRPMACLDRAEFRARIRALVPELKRAA